MKSKRIISLTLLLALMISNLLLTNVYGDVKKDVNDYSINSTSVAKEELIKISMVSATKESLDFGDLLKISAKIEGVSGKITSANITYTAPNSQKKITFSLKYNETTKLFEANQVINKYVEEGKWRGIYIYAEDDKNNRNSIYLEDEGDFTVSLKKREIGVISLIGDNRYDTATLLSKDQFAKTDTVVICNGAAIADGLTITPVAANLKAPILLTKKDTMPEVTKNEISRLGATNVIIAGGTSVVSTSVENELITLGIKNITRLGGKDRYETSLLIGKYLEKKFNIDIDAVFICNGYGEADALSVASASGSDFVPIILTEKERITEEAYNWVNEQHCSQIFVIGGNGVISDSLMEKVKNLSIDKYVSRLGGTDRYETNAIVIENVYKEKANGMDLYSRSNREYTPSIYIAKGKVLVDALSSGPVAALNGCPVILTSEGISNKQKSSLENIVANRLVRTGGGISDKAVNSIKEILIK